jgi:hypothetical protein
VIHGSLLEHGNVDEQLPIHTAIEYYAPGDVIQYLIEEFPGGLKEKMYNGDLPLHCAACFGCSSDVLDSLLCEKKGFSAAVAVENSNGFTPLQLLLDNQELWNPDYFVPQNLPLGNYYDRWSFQWDSSSPSQELTMIITVHSFESYINFLSTGKAIKTSSAASQLILDLGNDFIYEAQHIPVYAEQGMRIQQENQAKRIKQYYYFTLDADKYDVDQGAVYFNINGQKIMTRQITEPIIQINISTLASGVYEVKIVGEKGVQTGNFIFWRYQEKI